MCIESLWLSEISEPVLQTPSIPTTTRYGNTRYIIRVQAIKSFHGNDQDMIGALVQLYTYGWQGANLDGPYRIVVVAEPATSAPVKNQTLTRVQGKAQSLAKA